MFFVKDEERIITLHPSFLGANVQTRLWRKLLEDVEGKVVSDYFIIAILENHLTSEGKIIPGSGKAEYRLNYRAVCWRPFKGEVVDGLVNQVVSNGFFVDIGPMGGFVSRSMIPAEINYDDQAQPPQWTDNGDLVIEKGVHVRVRIKGVRPHVTGLFAVCTINEDFLGPMPGEV